MLGAAIRAAKSEDPRPKLRKVVSVALHASGDDIANPWASDGNHRHDATLRQVHQLDIPILFAVWRAIIRAVINGNCGENFVEAGNRGFTRLQPEEGCSVSESLPATFLAPSLGSRQVAAVSSPQPASTSQSLSGAL
jgi:hypothetical protein